MDWKLQRGSWRPRLLKLIESNDADKVQSISREAFLLIKEPSAPPVSSIKTSIITLSKLKVTAASMYVAQLVTEALGDPEGTCSDFLHAPFMDEQTAWHASCIGCGTSHGFCHTESGQQEPSFYVR